MSSTVATPKYADASATDPANASRPPLARNSTRSHDLEVLHGVGGEQDRRARIREATQVGEEPGAGGGIKARGRFVEKEHVRVGQQLDRDACPFALTTAQSADSHVALRPQVQPVERSALWCLGRVFVWTCGLLECGVEALHKFGGRHGECLGVVREA